MIRARDNSVSIPKDILLISGDQQELNENGTGTLLTIDILLPVPTRFSALLQFTYSLLCRCYFLGRSGQACPNKGIFLVNTAAPSALFDLMSLLSEDH